MVKIATSLSLATLVLDPTADTPLYRQLYQSLRQAILAGHLAPGTRLPSSRELARELGLSRTTVVNAFEQLLAEGYVEGKTGAGTYVARVLPDELLHLQGAVSKRALPGQGRRLLSARGQSLLTTLPLSPANQREPRAFRPGIPALDAFPVGLWRGLLTKYWQRPQARLLSSSHPAGYQPLREAIAAYLGTARRAMHARASDRGQWGAAGAGSCCPAAAGPGGCRLDGRARVSGRARGLPGCRGNARGSSGGSRRAGRCCRRGQAPRCAPGLCVPVAPISAGGHDEPGPAAGAAGLGGAGRSLDPGRRL